MMHDVHPLVLSPSLSNQNTGWAWLVQNVDKSLEVISTHDADNPLTHGKLPLLCCDVWEVRIGLDGFCSLVGLPGCFPGGKEHSFISLPVPLPVALMPTAVLTAVLRNVWEIFRISFF